MDFCRKIITGLINASTKKRSKHFADCPPYSHTTSPGMPILRLPSLGTRTLKA